MAIAELSNSLIQEKHRLIVELEKTSDSDQKIKIQEQIGKIESEIYNSAVRKIEQTKKETPQKFYEQKKEFTSRELRKIVNDKREVYKILAKQAYNLYNELVAKKREGVEIKTLISQKNKKALKMALKY